MAWNLFRGLNYYHPIRNRFKNIQRIPYKNSLSDNVVSCITEDKDKNLWIGTNDGGLNLYNTKTQQFTHYILQEDEREIGIGSNNIKAVYVDEQKSLVYIGTHAGGLTVLHRNSGKMESFNQLNSQLVNENVYAILPDKGGNLLLGTLSALVSFNPEKRVLPPLIRKRTVLHLLHNESQSCSEIPINGFGSGVRKVYLSFSRKESR